MRNTQYPISTTNPIPSRSKLMSQPPAWYQTAVFYELYVRAFQRQQRRWAWRPARRHCNASIMWPIWASICIWLLPTFPSPLVDDGYDIADYYGIHPDYGTLEDFKALIDAAHARGLQRHRRPGAEPHLRPASLVPGLAAARSALRRLLRLERHRPTIRRRPHHLPRHRAIQLDLGRGARAIFLASFLSASSPT